MLAALSRVRPYATAMEPMKKPSATAIGKNFVDRSAARALPVITHILRNSRRSRGGIVGDAWSGYQL